MMNCSSRAYFTSRTYHVCQLYTWRTHDLHQCRLVSTLVVMWSTSFASDMTFHLSTLQSDPNLSSEFSNNRHSIVLELTECALSLVDRWGMITQTFLFCFPVLLYSAALSRWRAIRIITALGRTLFNVWCDFGKAVQNTRCACGFEDRRNRKLDTDKLLP